jgi:peptidoglycan-associated lipoprotein
VTCTLEAVLFDFDQVALKARSIQALDRFATCLGKGNRSIRLEGHSDVRGDAEYNQLLGDRRADAVATYLGAHGVAEARLSKRSFGTKRPLCGEATEACYARNRRVEAVLSD